MSIVVKRRVPNTRAAPHNHLNGEAILLLLAATATALVVYFTSGSLPATAAVIVASLAVVAVQLRLSALEIVSVAIAVSFYIPGPVKLNLSLADLVLPALLVVGITSFAPPKLRSLERRVVAGGALLITAAVLSGFVAGVRGLPFEDLRFGIDLAKLVVVLAMAVALIRPIGRDLLEGRVRFASLWVLTSSTVSAAAIVTGAGLAPLLPQDAAGRVRGSFEDANLFAAYLIVSMMVASLSRVGRNRRPLGWEHLLLLGGILSTGSRGAAAAVGIGLITYLLVSDTSQRVRLVTVGVVLGGLTVAAGQSHRLGGINRLLNSANSTDDDVRFQLWWLALDLWSGEPLTGIGLGQFPLASPTYNPSQLLAHSTVLSFLAETGLVGFLALIVPIISIAVWAFRSRRSHPLAPSWLGGWAALVVMMCTVNLQNARFVWFAVAVSVVLMALPAQAWPGTKPASSAASPRGRGTSATSLRQGEAASRIVRAVNEK